MATKFDQARVDIRSQLSDLRREMAACHRDFIGATGLFLGLWFEEQVRRVLSENPGRFGELPPETRSQVKLEVCGLIDDADRIVRRFFIAEEVWWDAIDPSGARRHFEYEMNGTALPEHMDEPIRFAMGTLLPIMERHGFNASGFAIRRYTQPNNYRHQPERLPYYRQRYHCSAQMTQGLQFYANLHTAALAAERELVEVDRDEARSQDQVLWDQA